jgi:hypothetical protein
LVTATPKTPLATLRNIQGKKSVLPKTPDQFGVGTALDQGGINKRQGIQRFNMVIL